MNRPKKTGMRFVHEFVDGNRVVARFNRRGTAAVLDWKEPPNKKTLHEYLAWRDATQAAMSSRKSRWADLWPW